MEVRILHDHPEEASLWDAYVASSPGATSDHLWGWRKVLAHAFGFRESYYLGAFEEGRLRGILPLYRVPRGIGRSALTSIPFANYGGLCTDSDLAAQALLEKAKQILERTKAESLELRHVKTFSGLDLQNEKQTHARYFFPLSADFKQTLARLSSNKRNKMNRAVREGLTAKFSRNADLMYSIYRHTARRQGVPCFPKAYFESILEVFPQARLLFAENKGRAIAYYLILFFKKTLVCQFAGSFAQDYKQHPNEFLFYSAVEYGCKNGFEEFDFCRSRIKSGTAEYKRELRCTEEIQSFQYHFPKPKGHSTDGPARSRPQWMAQAWQRLPLPVTEAVGPVILRYFA